MAGDNLNPLTSAASLGASQLVSCTSTYVTVDTSISELDAAITGKPPPAKKKCGILKQGSILCNSDSIVKKKADG